MTFRLAVAAVSFVIGAAGCGPTTSPTRDCGGGPTNLQEDVLNCGACGVACGTGTRCEAGTCTTGICDEGAVEDCYDGVAETNGVGPCTKGTHTCQAGGFWSSCEGQVIPVAESCGDSVDNNCNGRTDETEDMDMDGYTTCAGNDCCDSTECTKPGLVNPGAFDAAGNTLDDDCNGVVDDSITLCDQNLASDSANGMDFAKAIDICKTATETDVSWGVITAVLTLPDGTGTPDPVSHAIRPRFGNGVQPQGGLSLAMLSTGAAAGKNDIKPAYADFVSTQTASASGFPADFYQLNGNALPNAPGCPPPDGTEAGDPVMLTLRIRVPSNAKSFRLSSNFFSAEFPEWTCSEYNDFFVVLLDSTYADMPANPADKNLAFYTPMGTQDQVPVGVNLAYGNTGLFTQCINGETGCSSILGGQIGNISTCIATDQLTGTGFDDPASGSCDTASLKGGGTGWLQTSGNVVPGEVITLRIAIWDTSDHLYDSLAVIDGFQWSVDVAQPGTVIF